MVSASRAVEELLASGAERPGAHGFGGAVQLVQEVAGVPVVAGGERLGQPAGDRFAAGDERLHHAPELLRLAGEGVQIGEVEDGLQGGRCVRVAGGVRGGVGQGHQGSPRSG